MVAHHSAETIFFWLVIKLLSPTEFSSYKKFQYQYLLKPNIEFFPVINLL